MDAIPCCRICGEETQDISHLFSPCLCRGSMKHVHMHCLEEWRRLAPTRSSLYQCNTCHYKYNLSRVWWVRILENPKTTLILSSLIIIATIITVALCIKYIGLMLFGLTYTRSVWILSRQLIWWSILTIGICTMIAIMIAGVREGAGPGVGPGVLDIFMPQTGVALHPGPSIEILGYVFSLGGFSIFAFTIYSQVENYSRDLLAQVSTVILEVQPNR